MEDVKDESMDDAMSTPCVWRNVLQSHIFRGIWNYWHIALFLKDAQGRKRWNCPMLQGKYSR